MSRPYGPELSRSAGGASGTSTWGTTSFHGSSTYSPDVGGGVPTGAIHTAAGAFGSHAITRR